MRKNRVVFFIFGITLVITMLFQFISKTQVIDLNAQEGRLRVFQMSSNQVYALKGAWTYFPDKSAFEIGTVTDPTYVEVEHLWEKNEDGWAFGIASYRLTLTGLVPGIHYGIYVQDEAASYQLRINGELVLNNGTPSSNPNIYVGDVQVKTGIFQSDKQGQAVLVMTIANYDRTIGGFWNPVIIGSIGSIDGYSTRISAVEIFMLATMLSLGLFFLLLSSIDSERRTLYMSIFSFAVAFRVMATGTHLLHALVPSMSVLTMTRLDYLSGYLLVPIGGWLVESFGFIPPIKAVKQILIALVLMVVVFCGIASDLWFEKSYLIYQIIAIIYMIYGMVVIVQGLRRKIAGAFFIGTGILVLIIGGVLELFFPEVKYGLFFCSFMFVLILTISVMGRFASIHSRKEHLESEVLTDALTQVGNRAGLYKELQSVLTNEVEWNTYLLFIDLNKFKSINDVYGHKVGDAVLIETAGRLKQSTRQSDRIFRYGGDEFVIIANLAPSFSIESLIQRLKASFETPFIIDGLTLMITLAIGYEHLKAGESSIDEIMKHSDFRMYEDKRAMKE